MSLTPFANTKAPLKPVAESTSKATTDAKPAVAAKAIDDFGEKLGGARKDQAPTLASDVTDQFIADNPLSKVWPSKEVDAITDPFTAALAFAARAEVPAKPRKSYLVKRWVERVKTVRGLAQHALEGKLTADDLAGRQGLGDFGAKVKLLQAVDRSQWSRIDGVREAPDAYTYATVDGKKGERVPSPHVSVNVDGKWHRFDGKSIDEVMDQARALVGEAAPEKKLHFEVRGRTGAYFINKKGDSEYRRLKTFPTAEEAVAYRKDHYDDLVKAWDDVKASDNVTKADMRRTTNKDRSGQDYRGGKDVVPEQFDEAFGFRGVEFGNWVKQGKGAKQRQAMLNNAYDAMMDLANVIGVPPRALSLNGTLGLALGSRGHGLASAHFQPDRLVINLTKTKGAGALAHEWFHALDNYFARTRGEPVFKGDQDAYRRDAFVTYRPEPLLMNKQRPDMKMSAAELAARRAKNPTASLYKAENWTTDPAHPQGVRPEVEKAFSELVDALNASPMRDRALSIDKGKSDGYWSRIIERGARSFENYVIAKLEDRGITNDYLANVTSIEDFNRSHSRYPYLTNEELAPVSKAFDNLFSTIETEPGEGGNVRLFSRGAEDASAPVSADQAAHTAKIEAIASDLKKAWKGDDLPAVKVVDTPEQLPASAKRDPETGKPDNAYKTAAGMYDGKTIWLVADRHPDTPAGRAKIATTMAHEAVGHYGIDRIVTRELGDQAWNKIESNFDRLRNDKSLGSKAMRSVLDSVERRYPGADSKTFARESLAVMAERGVNNGLLARAVAAVRAFLHRMMPDLKLSENDIRGLLVKSKEFIERGETYAQRVQSRAALAFSRTKQTKANYERRIDQLFAGDKPNALGGVRALDEGDLLTLTGYGNMPVVINESHAIGDGRYNHSLTAEQWKKMPEWLDNPAAVFERTRDGHLTMIGPELVNGHAVIIGLEPKANPAGGGGSPRHLVLTAFEKDRGVMPLKRMVLDGDLKPLYIDQRKGSGFDRASGVSFPSKIDEIRSHGAKVFTERDLVKFRKSREDATSFAREPDNQTDTPAFREFFGTGEDGSKVVDAAGEPLPVYHGTAEDFAVFHDKGGAATGHATSALGHFFTPDKRLAEGYARNASEGRPADERVIDAFLSIRKPYTLPLAKAQDIDTLAAAKALRAKLEGQGYDGIHIPESNTWVAFQSTQIKSASENRGTFDSNTGNIYYSRDKNDRGETEEPGKPRAPFSHAADSMKSVDPAVNASQGMIVQKLKDMARGKYEDVMPKLLMAVQRRFLTELMMDHAALKGARSYDELVQGLGTRKSQLLTGSPDAAEHPLNMLKKGGAAIADELRIYTHEKGFAGWLGRKSAEGKELADIQHQSTIHGIDPSEPYEKLKMKGDRGEYVEWTPALVKKRIAILKEVMMGRSGDNKRPMMDEIKSLRNLKFREKERTKAFPALVARYNAMPEKGRDLYRQQRDWHSQMSDAVQAALIARVDSLRGDLEQGDPELAAKYSRMLVQKIREEFESQRVEGVYFPLNRSGDFYVSYKDGRGAQGFQMFETAAAQNRFVKDMRQRGGAVEAVGRRDGQLKAKDAPSGTFIADIMGTLKKAGASDQIQDDVYQTFLRTLPEMSMRKHAIHRKATPGFSDDISRGFAKTAFHGGHQLARLEYTHQMQSTIDQLQRNMDAYRKQPGVDPNDVSRGDAYLGSLKQRHQSIMSPTDSSVANAVNGVGFMWYLGASPASALVNLTQNAQVTLPVLGAHHGWPNAMKELGRAVKDSMRTGGNIDRTLKDLDERRAYNTLRARGDIDKTRAHDLAGIAEGNLIQTNPVYAKVMAGMTWMFHHAEVINREAAGMASYRLARQRGDSFNDAVQYASDIINGTHFDYSADNRPPIMQGNAPRIAFQFKNYSIGMSQLMYRNMYQAFQGETPEVRRMARRTVTGLLGMTGLMAGTLGLPIINVISLAANAAHAAFGDDNDDTPWDFDTEFRNWLVEHFGDTAANWIADGAVSHLTGVNIANRVGMSDMWFRDADQQMDANASSLNLAEAILGPQFSTIENVYRGT